MEGVTLLVVADGPDASLPGDERRVQGAELAYLVGSKAAKMMAENYLYESPFGTSPWAP
jgi:hypothetical protein